MSQKPNSQPTLSVGKDGYAYVDGVKIARYVSDRQVLQFVDRDRRRCLQKGREFVEISVTEFGKLVGNK